MKTDYETYALPTVHCKREVSPLVREGVPPHQEIRNCQIKHLVLSPKWVLDTKKDWPIDRR
jgi:hypothetical protein